MVQHKHIQIKNTKVLIKISLVASLIAITGILAVVFLNNTSKATEISKASNLNELTTETKVIALNTSGNNELIGLNSRAQSCSTDVKGVIDWGSRGTLLDPVGKVDTCVNKTATWYHVKWDNGVEGWTIGDFLDFQTKADQADQAK